MELPPPKQMRKLILQILFLLALAGGGVGVWVGKTWVIRGDNEPPKVTASSIAVLSVYGKSSPVAVIDATCDQLCRLEIRLTKTDGTQESYFIPSATANQWRCVLSDTECSWYTLAPGVLPSWIAELKIIPHPLPSAED